MAATECCPADIGLPRAAETRRYSFIAISSWLFVIGGIGRRANHYLRRQMIHGGRAVMSRLTKHNDRRSQWLKELAARRGFNRALVALANKTARIAWVLLARKEEYVAA